MTACDAKGTTGDTATFTAGGNMTLHIALDSRVEQEPDWLADYTLMRTMLNSSNDVTFKIYDKKVKKGETITLGSNGQTYMCVNFFALATQDISIGDINEDGEISIADVVTLSGYLLGRAPLSDSQKRAADLTDDGKLNVFDLILLKRKVTKAE